jgi:hypothetical protein
MKRTVPKGILSAAAVLAVALAGTSPASAHGRGRGRCLSPTGGDDTERLQSALDSCAGAKHGAAARHGAAAKHGAGAKHGCEVRLCEGVFRTAPLRVGDFRGTLRGSGGQQTVIQALPDLAVNPNPFGYWRDDPLDPGVGPWPYLLQFIGGQGTIRDLTLEVPEPGPGSKPTTGWIEFSDVDFEVVRYEMAGALLITGREPVSFEIQDVRVVGEGEDLDLSLLAGVSVRGLILNPADASEFPVYPLPGRVSLKHNELAGMITAVSLGELDDAEILIARNRLQAYVAVDLLDASRSRVRVLKNDWDTEYLGVQITLNIDGQPSVDNLFFIAANRGMVGPFFGAAAGIFFQDPWLLPEPGESALGVVGNHLTVGRPDEPAYSGIEAHGAGFLKIWHNDLRGGATAGVRVNQTTRCRISRNDLDDFAVSGGFDFELGLDTSECLVVVGPDDTVDDDGTNNRVYRLR